MTIISDSESRNYHDDEKYHHTRPIPNNSQQGQINSADLLEHNRQKGRHLEDCTFDLLKGLRNSGYHIDIVYQPRFKLDLEYHTIALDFIVRINNKFILLECKSCDTPELYEKACIDSIYRKSYHRKMNNQSLIIGPKNYILNYKNSSFWFVGDINFNINNFKRNSTSPFQIGKIKMKGTVPMTKAIAIHNLEMEIHKYCKKHGRIFSARYMLRSLSIVVVILLLMWSINGLFHEEIVKLLYKMQKHFQKFTSEIEILPILYKIQEHFQKFRSEILPNLLSSISSRLCELRTTVSTIVNKWSTEILDMFLNQPWIYL